MAEVVDTVEDIAMRLKPVVTLGEMRSNMTLASAAGGAADQSPDQLYQSACLACHTTGAAGAPTSTVVAAGSARTVSWIGPTVETAGVTVTVAAGRRR